MKEYEDVLTMVRKEYGFPTVLLLTNKSTLEQIDCIKQFIATAFEWGSWKEVTNFFHCLLRATEDHHLIPLCQEKVKKEKKSLILVWSKEIEVAKLVTEKEKEELALLYYNKLLLKNPSSTVPGATLALLGFKRFLLKTILNYWGERQTSDSEADRVFSCVSAIVVPNSKDEKMAAEIVYEVANRITYDRRIRLIKALLLLPPTKNRIAKSLALNLAKLNLETFDRFREELKISQLLDSASPAAISYLQKETWAIVAFDKKLREMVRFLQPDNLRFQPEWVPGKITWAFPCPQPTTAVVNILITIEADPNSYPRGVLDKKGHEYFENARSRVQKWSECLTQWHKINLELRLVNQYNEKNVLFRRTGEGIWLK